MGKTVSSFVPVWKVANLIIKNGDTIADEKGLEVNKGLFSFVKVPSRIGILRSTVDAPFKGYFGFFTKKRLKLFLGTITVGRDGPFQVDIYGAQNYDAMMIIVSLLENEFSKSNMHLYVHDDTRWEIDYPCDCF
jgi:hypothetical protein